MFSILTLVDGSEVYDMATAKEKGEPALEPSELRGKVIKIISIRRYDMMRNLACEFGVFWQTIFRDMQVLAEEYPLINEHGTIKAVDSTGIAGEFKQFLV